MESPKLTENLSINEKDIPNNGIVSGLMNSTDARVSSGVMKSTDTNANLDLPGILPSRGICLGTACSLGNLRNFVISTTVHILRKGSDHSGLTRGAFSKMQDLVRQYGQNHLASLLSAPFGSCDASINRVQLGCVKFVLNVKSREGLERLWAMYSSGELSKKLTEVLVTDELVPGDKTDITIQTTIDRSDYEQGLKLFDELEEARKESSEGVVIGLSGQPDPERESSADQPGTSSQTTEPTADTT